MAFKVLFAAAVIAAATALPAETQYMCGQGIAVDYDTDTPTVSCVSPCPSGDDGFMRDGTAYKRFETLDGYGLMVQVIFEGGRFAGCKLVPLQTDDELAARDALRQSCRAQIFGDPITTTTAAAPTTPEPTTAAPTTPEPTTAAPTTPEPTTAVPTTPEPTTAAPTTPEPTTAAPTTPAPTTPAPTTPEPTTAAPTTPPTTTTPAPVEIRKRCLEGFTLVGDSCYMVTPYPANKLEASKYCSKYGAKSTAIIESREEQNRLQGALSTSVWIELNDQRKEGQFTAPGLGRNYFTNWRSEEPNNANNGEDCVALVDQWNYAWNDADCAASNRGLCESAPLPVFEEPKCAAGQYKFEDSCYFFSGRANFGNAAAECKRKGGYPAFVNSQKEQDFLASIANENVYLGYTDNAQESVFVAENFGVMIYKNWNTATNEPNNLNKKEHCSELNKGMGNKWNDLDCGTVQRAICETAPISKCAAGQYKFQDSCYFFSGAGDFDAGAAECRRDGGYPAFVNSQQEQDFLKGIVRESVFLGYTDRAQESVFVADDIGEPFYTSWRAGEPNDANNNEDCTEMRSSMDYSWNDISCATVQRTLCETPASYA